MYLALDFRNRILCIGQRLTRVLASYATTCHGWMSSYVEKIDAEASLQYLQNQGIPTSFLALRLLLGRVDALVV